VAAELLHADKNKGGQTDGQTNMTKLSLFAIL